MSGTSYSLLCLLHIIALSFLRSISCRLLLRDTCRNKSWSCLLPRAETQNKQHKRFSANSRPNYLLQTANLTVTSRHVTSRHITLDDFLEKQAECTRLVVIATSSYGFGRAPLSVGLAFANFVMRLSSNQDKACSRAFPLLSWGWEIPNT
jgi:hypothetical protein